MSSVDAFEMALVHRAFRKGFRELADLFRSVEGGDIDRATLVGDHVEFMLAALHHHHSAEDELLWPKLHARARLRDADIAQMERQHREIAALADTLQRVLSPWTRSAEPQLVSQLTVGADRLSGQIDEHLAKEEKTIVPLINEYLTQLEWQECLDRWASILSARNLRSGLVLAGLILENATPEERRRFLAGVPFVPRMLLKSFAERTCTSYRAVLHARGR